MTAIANLPDLRPSLLLDFANSGRVDPRIQCIRASSATYFGPDGKLRTVAANVPRIDYGPLTGKCLGLLSEPSRTNLLINSISLSGYSQGSNGSYTNGRTSIDGVTPSKRVTANAVGNVYVARASISVTPGPYTLSIYFCADVKPASGTILRAEELQADGSRVVRVLSVTHPSVIADGKWRRYELTVTHASAGTVSIFFAVDTTPGTSIDICGGQYEAGASASSLILTGASAATRPADVQQIDGLSFAQFYNKEAGSLLAKYTYTNAGAAIASIDGGSTVNRFALDAPEPTQHRVRSVVDGSTTFQLLANTNAGQATVGFAFQKNDFAFCTNGGAPTTSSSGDIPAVHTLRIGNNATSEFQLGGHISWMVYYPKRITNDQLQRLTA
jgi:hypothetical protein